MANGENNGEHVKNFVPIYISIQIEFLFNMKGKDGIFFLNNKFPFNKGKYYNSLEHKKFGHHSKNSIHNSWAANIT